MCGILFVVQIFLGINITLWKIKLFYILNVNKIEM